MENPLNCSNCKMQQIKIFLQSLTFSNYAAATMCDGGTLLFNYEFDDCTGSMLKIHNSLKKKVVYNNMNNGNLIIFAVVNVYILPNTQCTYIYTCDA